MSNEYHIDRLSASATPSRLTLFPKDAQQAHVYAFNAIYDLQAANQVNVGNIKTLQTAATKAVSAASSSSSSSVTTAQAQTIATTQANNAIASTFGTVNNQTGTTYTVQQSDYGGIITFDNASATAVTLNNGTTTTVNPQWWAFLQNNGAGTVTLTPASGNINGVANLALVTAQSAAVFFDGTNWWAATSTTGGGGGGVTSLDSITGAITLVAGAGITINDNTPSAGDIQLVVSGTAAYLTGTVTINFTATSGTFTSTVTIAGATTGQGAILCDPSASFDLSGAPLFQNKGCYVAAAGVVHCSATISGFISPPGNVNFPVIVFP